MAIIRAQVVHEHASGLPRDRAVNTFHFEGLISDANLVGIREAVARFFYNHPSDPTGSVSAFLANHMANFTVRLYNVTGAPPHPPLLVSVVHGYQARQAVTDLPSEVAGCLSFEGTPEGGLIQSRRRGRVYIGPLNVAAASSAGAGGVDAVRRPSTAFNNAIRTAGQRLANEVDPFAEWVVYSRPFAGRGEVIRPGKSTLPAIAARPGSTVNIDRVWTDDAFDTQRRRGERATSKVYATTS